MARIKARGRKRMKKSTFAGKGRSFPIPDRQHARLALQQASRSRKASYAGVKKKVCAKYPGMPVCKRGGNK